MSEQDERRRFVEVARTWVGTPYHHQGRVKGVGVDCATIIAECAYEAGFADKPIDLPFYTFQWNVNQDQESYLNVVRQYMHEVPQPTGPGDIVVWQFGKTYSHGAIILDWPRIIHAVVGRKVEYEDVSTCSWLNKIGRGPDIGKVRPRLFFSRWGQ